jgi:hypothetical protein
MSLSPKTRWRNRPQTGTLQFSDLSADLRLDPTYYEAKKVCDTILKELTHKTLPTLSGFMENIDFMLDHLNLIAAAKQTWAAAQVEAAEANLQVKKK